jgi:hypothetical protein
MHNLTHAELDTALTTTQPDHTAMTNDDLICAVMGNDNATATELELAQRLELALNEITMLTAERGSVGQVQH